VTLLASAAERNLLLCVVLQRRAQLHSRLCRRCRSISPAGKALSSKPAAAAGE